MVNSMEVDEQLVVERTVCSYENRSAKYAFNNKRSFDVQYSQIYAERLKSMKDSVARAARRKWGADVPVTRLSEIKVERQCIVIGTLFRKMELQPSILKEVSAEEGVLPLPPSARYATDEDEFVLEDEQQRIVMTGNIDRQALVTGMVLAIMGEEVAGGVFETVDHCFAGLPPQPTLQLDQTMIDGEDRFVVLISDLGLGSKTLDDHLSLHMLVDLVTGRLGSSHEQELFSKVARFIICGNSLSEDTLCTSSDRVAKYKLRNVQAKSVEAMDQLDELVCQIGTSVPVDIMPGELDPTSCFLPQQPIHRCMFPKSNRLATVHSVTNPYECTIGGVTMLGSAGQNINNIFQYSGLDDRDRIMEATLEGGHIAPTTPDTLSCYPYTKQDPFILDSTPHVYFVGNQPEFSARMHNSTTDNGQTETQVCIVSVPSFRRTHTAVLMNLRDLNCQPLCVSASFDDEGLNDMSR